VEEPEVVYQRRSLFGPETFTLKVLGLRDIREATLGETVKINARGTDFVVKSVQILEWMERYGDLVGEVR